jgi:hypothetical protein
VDFCAKSHNFDWLDVGSCALPAVRGVVGVGRSDVSHEHSRQDTVVSSENSGDLATMKLGGGGQQDYFVC